MSRYQEIQQLQLQLQSQRAGLKHRLNVSPYPWAACLGIASFASGFITQRKNLLPSSVVRLATSSATSQLLSLNPLGEE